VSGAQLEQTTGADPLVQALSSAQVAEVMARYDADEAGPGPGPDVPFLLARLDGRPVGCVGLAPLDGAVGEVKRMYVDPAARGHRIGRLLLGGVERLAAAHGYRLLRLEAGTEQPEALRLYASAGWSRIPCYGFFKDDPRTVCFEKPVTGHPLAD